MRLKENINLGHAFEMLKETLKQADESREGREPEGYVIAYAKLSGVVGAILDYVEDKGEGEMSAAEPCNESQSI